MKKSLALLSLISICFAGGCQPVNQEKTSVLQIPVTSSTASSTSSTGDMPASTGTQAIQNQPGTSTTQLQDKQGKPFTVEHPADIQIFQVASGFKYLRFMAMSPDHRLFVGEMDQRGDSKSGRVLILENFDPQTKTFKTQSTYLENQRNPHSLAFYTDKDQKTWLYVAETDKLSRYPYTEGDRKPNQKPEIIATFPDDGESFKIGGWHLTRTVIVHDDKLYVSVGSSCNSCEEKASEPQRGTILTMNPDGSDQQILASGFRNAVGINFVGDTLYATTNGPDHLGDDKPDDGFYDIQNYDTGGWPYCYETNGKVLADTSKKWKNAIDCTTVNHMLVNLGPHSAPLGFDSLSEKSIIIALHGSGKKDLATGYSIIEVTHDGETYTKKDLITGFLRNNQVRGRIVGILRQDEHSFFATDDVNGSIYYIERKAQ